MFTFALNWLNCKKARSLEKSYRFKLNEATSTDLFPSLGRMVAIIHMNYRLVKSHVLFVHYWTVIWSCFFVVLSRVFLPLMFWHSVAFDLNSSNGWLIADSANRWGRRCQRNQELNCQRFVIGHSILQRPKSSLNSNQLTCMSRDPVPTPDQIFDCDGDIDARTARIEHAIRQQSIHKVRSNPFDEIFHFWTRIVLIFQFDLVIEMVEWFYRGINVYFVRDLKNENWVEVMRAINSYRRFSTCQPRGGQTSNEIEETLSSHLTVSTRTGKCPLVLCGFALLVNELEIEIHTSSGPRALVSVARQYRNRQQRGNICDEYRHHSSYLCKYFKNSAWQQDVR